MKNNRYHDFKEAAEAIKEINADRKAYENNKEKEANRYYNEMAENIRDLKEFREMKEKAWLDYKDLVCHRALSTAFKGIYIGALQEVCQMEDDEIDLAESLVDKYINENGGAREILLRMKHSSNPYQNSLAVIIEEAEEETEAEADEEEVATTNVPDQADEKVLDSMEKDGDTDVAVELISKRIADAEEEFIQKNAEDKKKIETIVNDINDRIKKTKEDPDVSDEDKEEIEQEATIECKRKIAQVRDRRTSDVFDVIVHNVAESVTRNSKIRQQYIQESGSLDMNKVVNTTKIAYGLLEFLNTLELEKITPEYVKRVLVEM